MIKASIQGSLNFPEVFVDRKDLKKIAEDIIIKNIKKFLDAEVGLDGTGHPDLEPATWKMKKSDKKLYETGKLRSAIQYDWKGNGIVIGFKNIEDRNNIARYLQVEGVGRKKKTFLFFGVNDLMEDKAYKFLELQVKKAIQRGGRRTNI